MEKPEAGRIPGWSVRLFRAVLDKVPRRLRLPVRYRVAQLQGSLEPEMDYLSRLVGSGRTAIDVGANNGLYTYRLARICDEVHAFEPLPMCNEIIEAWGHPHVTLHRSGLSDHPDELGLKVPIIRGVRYTGVATFEALSCDHEVVPVPVERLDDLEIGDVTFIKIDVEGHESAVLRGAEATIARDRPVILVEIEQEHIGQRPIGSVFEQVMTMGYEGFFLRDGHFVGLDDFDLERDQDRRSPRPYINNFVFVAHGDARAADLVT